MQNIPAVTPNAGKKVSCVASPALSTEKISRLSRTTRRSIECDMTIPFFHVGYVT